MINREGGQSGRWSIETMANRNVVNINVVNWECDQSGMWSILTWSNGTLPLRRVRERPDEFPDYIVRHGKLYRHVLHSTDFREVPADLQ